MDTTQINKISNKGRKNDFRNFDQLEDSTKGMLMKNWDSEMKHRYLTRNPVMSEDEFFEILDKIADGKYDIEEDKEILI